MITAAYEYCNHMYILGFRFSDSINSLATYFFIDISVLGSIGFRLPVIKNSFV